MGGVSLLGMCLLLGVSALRHLPGQTMGQTTPLERTTPPPWDRPWDQRQKATLNTLPLWTNTCENIITDRKVIISVGISVINSGLNFVICEQGFMF